MNPYLDILQKLQRKSGIYVAPPQQNQGANSPFKMAGGFPRPNLMHPMLQRRNSFQMPISTNQQPQQTMNNNPYMNFLKNFSVGQPKQTMNSNAPFLNQPGAPGAQQGVMTGNFNTQNLIIPNKQIPNQLAMDSDKQKEGDLIA